jgi:hypothetical protein
MVALFGPLETQQPPTWLRAYSACPDLSRIGIQELMDDQPFTTTIHEDSIYIRVNSSLRPPPVRLQASDLPPMSDLAQKQSGCIAISHFTLTG